MGINEPQVGMEQPQMEPEQQVGMEQPQEGQMYHVENLFRVEVHRGQIYYSRQCEPDRATGTWEVWIFEHPEI